MKYFIVPAFLIACAVGWSAGEWSIEHYEGPRENDCSTALPEEIVLEEGMAQFHGNLGCGVEWIKGESLTLYVIREVTK